MNQCFQRLGDIICAFDFNRDKIICAAGEKILFKGGIILFIVEQGEVTFNQCFRDDVFIESAFINAKVPVCAKFFLCFRVKGGNQQT